jgi:hypothetical protein
MPIHMVHFMESARAVLQVPLFGVDDEHRVHIRGLRESYVGFHEHFLKVLRT